MKITKKSQMLIDVFDKNPCISTPPNDNTTNNILSILHKDILDAYTDVKDANINPKIEINDIENVQNIPYPSMFPASSFPNTIRNHINVTSQQKFVYNVKYLKRDITFYFTSESNTYISSDKYVKYAEDMLAWLYIVDQYASRWCAKKLSVYIYFTSLEKFIPQSNLHVLGENHANTAFTTTCPSTSEIVVFRKEEWFKAFVHETFHNFALDFSDMDNDACHSKIKKIFNVTSLVNLFESYTEFWAETINICFHAYYSIKNKSNTRLFLQKCNTMFEIERNYSVFQMIKALGFMGLTYKTLYSKSKKSQLLRNTLYREETNILAYYVIKTILMVNYTKFLPWCQANNTSLLQFKKTSRSQTDFCKFIEDNYKSKNILDLVECNEEYIGKLIEKRPRDKKKQSHLMYLLNNLRMTICELH